MAMAVPLGVATMGWSVLGTRGYRIVSNQIAKRRSEKGQGIGQGGVLGKGEDEGGKQEGVLGKGENEGENEGGKEDSK